MRDIMAKTFRTTMPTTLIKPQFPRKYKFRFKERSRSLYTSRLSRKDQDVGANVVCLANLASHVITRDLISQGIIYLKEKN